MGKSSLLARFIRQACKGWEPRILGFVKSSAAREEGPIQREWWYCRLSSVLLRLYRLGRGVKSSALRRFYGGSSKIGCDAPCSWSGSRFLHIISLETLDELGMLLKNKENGVCYVSITK